MVRNRPELLRSEEHEYKMARLQAGQQGLNHQYIDASTLPPVANPKALASVAEKSENESVNPIIDAEE